ncbi:MAG: ComF family protein [Bacteroidetes bacterium]|nr:ComF family protein [Bacteroidota bacterium]MCH8522985.1 ComF family protein [Balneolales bacterium]
MRVLQDIVQEAVVGFRQMLFPGVCLSCGMPDVDGMELLCPFCRENRFDPANPFRTDSCPGVILPAVLRYQYAMWRYDKGGVLQRLLHNIKYNGLGRLAFELGCIAGVSMRNCPALDGAINTNEPLVLLPVPLHPRRRRMRGFNQAELIALGISQVTGIPVLSDDIVVRTRYTNTQTGFSLMARTRNLNGAFKILNEEEITGKSIIIVDDVFTTGATVFSLAEILNEGNPSEIGVVTIAHA